MAREADVYDAGVNLVLADHHLRLSGKADLVREAVEIMTPPCTSWAADAGDVDWTIQAGVRRPGSPRWSARWQTPSGC